MEIQKLGSVVLLIIILFVAFLIRVQGTPDIPEGHFTSNDAFFYYWQAQLVSEHGQLPERDMHRWLPLGRDLGQTLNLYGYVLAYAHQGVTLFFPNISLYHVTLYAPAVWFCIGLGALCLFLSRAFGLLFSSLVGVLLATLPGTIGRSAAGFSDRDSWCLMLGILAVITYLASLPTQPWRKRFFWTLASGVLMFLGGLSWEGFGVFLSVILLVELWRFLTSEAEYGLGFYLIWVMMFVPALYLATPAYRNGQFFATHLFAFMLVPPVVVLGIRLLRHLLLTKTQWGDRLKPHARTLALGLTCVGIAIAIGYVFTQRATFADTTVPFSQTALMQTVDELENPLLVSWMVRYGSVFILGGLGIVMAIVRFWKTQGVLLAASLALFTVTAFYRSALEALWGASVGNLLFGVAIAGCLIGYVVLAWRRQRHVENECTYFAFTGWFLFWVALARGANRYDFFIGISLAFFTADLICYLTDFYGDKVKRRVPQLLLKTAIPATMLFLIMFWTPVGGHANRTLLAATKLRRVIPGNGSVARTFGWMKDNLPHTAVVAAHWRYGGQLNVLAGVKTIVDPDHYIPHWIHLYNQHIYRSTSEREVLEFLKTHGVTHLMVTGKNPSKAFLGGQPSEAFVPIYPTKNFASATVNVWEIHYPSDIKLNPKYLETAPGD